MDVIAHKSTTNKIWNTTWSQHTTEKRSKALHSTHLVNTYYHQAKMRYSDRRTENKRAHPSQATRIHDTHSLTIPIRHTIALCKAWSIHKLKMFCRFNSASHAIDHVTEPRSKTAVNNAVFQHILPECERYNTRGKQHSERCFAKNCTSIHYKLKLRHPLFDASNDKNRQG
jgi:hypothetical protein